MNLSDEDKRQYDFLERSSDSGGLSRCLLARLRVGCPRQDSARRGSVPARPGSAGLAVRQLMATRPCWIWCIRPRPALLQRIVRSARRLQWALNAAGIHTAELQRASQHGSLNSARTFIWDRLSVATARPAGSYFCWKSRRDLRKSTARFVVPLPPTTLLAAPKAK